MSGIVSTTWKCSGCGAECEWRDDLSPPVGWCEVTTSLRGLMPRSDYRTLYYCDECFAKHAGALGYARRSPA